MAEIDISKKITDLIKYGFFSIFGLSLLVAGGIYFFQHNRNYIKIYDAQIMNSLVNVPVRTNGEISEILVTNATLVKPGDNLAKIKVNITPEQIKQLEETVEIAKKNLEKARAGMTVSQPVYSSGASSNDIAQAEEYLQRMEKLYALGAVSAAKRDEAAASLEAAKSGAYGHNVHYETTVIPANPQAIQLAELQVKQAEASLERAKRESSATIITAPISGTLFHIGDIQQGDTVRPGQVIFGIGNADNFWIEAYTTPEQTEKFKLGQFATYTINNNKLQGTVVEIKPAAEHKSKDDSKANKDLIKISLIPPKDMVLKPGDKITVEIALE